jgi:hypothetical protein
LKAERRSYAQAVCWRSVLPCDVGEFSRLGAVYVYAADEQPAHLHQFRQRAHAFYQYRDRDKPERHNDQFRNGQRVCVGDHTGGGVAAATNSGSNIANGILAQTGAGGARVSF